MRNLKRALSLGLTAAMISGLMVMGSSAASSSYTDVADTNNVEAIEVLKAVGIMVGDESGDFNPDQKVTRNEMAVVMSNLMAYNVATYKNTSPFTDVPSWAEPYVAACYTNGITSGYSATVYGGSDSVTTAQAALMLMKALGYFQYSSDFGNDWQLSTVAQGNKIDLFEDVDSGVKEAMTRNDLAQLVLNTLEAGTVEASSDVTHVTTGDVSVTTGKVEYNYVTSQKDYAKAISKTEAVYATGISTSGYIVELGEKLYDGDLKKTGDTVDDFGRPATEWKYGTETVGTFAKTPDATWTAKVTKKALYEAATKSVVDDLESGEWSMEYYVDGVGTSVKKGDIDKYMDKSSTEKINNDADTGNGTLTELYVDDDNDQVTVVVSNTYVFQATEDYNKSKNEVKVTNAGDTDEYGITLDDYALDGDDFDIAGVSEDDYLLLTVTKTAGSKYEVQSVTPAEVVSGEIESFSKEDDVTIDGTTYKYSAKTDKNGVKGEITATGGTTTLILDQYGYVIAVDDTVVSGNYVYIEAAGTTSNISKTVEANAYFSDGTNATITLKKVDGKTSSSIMKDANGWYTYSKDSNNEYTLNSVKGSYASTNGADRTATGQILYNGRAALENIGVSGIKANEKTVFVIVDEDGDVNVYTGVSNAPDITVKSLPNSETYRMDYVYRTKGSSTNYATYVFVSVDELSDVLVDASTEDDTYIFLTDLNKTRNDGKDTYYVYNAIQDGVVTTVETDDNSYGAMQLYTKIKTDSSTDRITGMSELAVDKTDDTYVKSTMTDAPVTYSAGVLTIGGKSFIVNKDSNLNLILDYSENGGKDPDVRAMMSDKGEDYEVFANVGGSTIKSTLNGYTVSGYYYVVTEDDYKNGNGNTTLDHLYLYVDAAKPTSGADNEQGGAQDDGNETKLPSTSDMPVSGTNVNGRYLASEGKLYLQLTGLTAGASKVTVPLTITENGSGKLSYQTITVDVQKDTTVSKVYELAFTPNSATTSINVTPSSVTVNEWYMSYGEGVTGPATIENNTTNKIELTVAKPEGATEYKYNVTASSFTAEAGSAIGSDVEHQTADAKVEVKLSSTTSAPNQITVTRTVTKYALNASMAANAYSADNGVKLAGLTNVTEMAATGGNLTLDVVLTGTASADNKVVVTYTVNGDEKTVSKDCTASNNVSIDLSTGALVKATTVVVTKVELQSKVTINNAPTKTGNWTNGTATVEVKNGSENVASASTYVPVGTSLAVSIKLDSDATFSNTGVKFVLGSAESKAVTTAGEQTVTVGNYQVVVGSNTVNVTVKDA